MLMAGSFSGIEIAFQGLLVQRKALQVTAHNIANANTDGYSRQRVSMSSIPPHRVPEYTDPGGEVGNGVAAEFVERVRDRFLDLQMRNELGRLGRWERRETTLKQIETFINEPSDEGLSSIFGRFWEALEALSLDPENNATRVVVIERGRAVAEAIRHLDSQLEELARNLDETVYTVVSRINSLATRISDLNHQVVKLLNTGGNPNDYLDRRDVLLDELSRLVSISLDERETGAIVVMVGGTPLVSEHDAGELKALPDPANRDLAQVVWADTGRPVEIQKGELKGLLESRDEINGSIRTGLDELVATFVQEFNAVHSSGYDLNGQTGQDFFVPGSTASSIALEEAVEKNPAQLAASLGGGPGDGGNALKLAGLKHTRIFQGGTATLDDFLRSFVGAVAVDTAEATRMLENQTLLVRQIENQRQSVAGVSLDEEMTNLVRYQHAYNAAARVVTAVDEMLEVVINRMGLVGR